MFLLWIAAILSCYAGMYNSNAYTSSCKTDQRYMPCLSQYPWRHLPDNYYRTGTTEMTRCWRGICVMTSTFRMHQDKLAAIMRYSSTFLIYHTEFINAYGNFCTIYHISHQIYTHFATLWFLWVLSYLLKDSHDSFTHILVCSFTGTGAIMSMAVKWPQRICVESNWRLSTRLQ